MSEERAVVPREESPHSIVEELDRRRSEARTLELQVSRKEAELQRAKEEQALLKEMRTMNEMILRKKELQESEGVLTGLKISPESLSELKELEDALKLENHTTAELQHKAELTSRQMEEVERSLEQTEHLLAEAKHSTGWDVDRNSARTETAMENEYRGKKMLLTSLTSEHRTLTELTERLKRQAEELTDKITAADELDVRFAEAEEELRQTNTLYKELEEQVRSNERIQRKTERALTVAHGEDKYKTIRQLEGDKKVLHNNLSKLRETNVSNSKSILSLEVRLRQLETRLESVNVFLQDVFAEVEDDEAMEGVPEDAAEVPLVQFEELSAALELSRETVAHRDAQLEEHDSKVEQLERKVSILQNAIVSRQVSSEVQNRSRERHSRRISSTQSQQQRQLQAAFNELCSENAALKRSLGTVQ